MAKHRSFTEFLNSEFYNQMFYAVKDFVYKNRSKLEIRSYSISNIDYAALQDISIKAVGIDDREGMGIAFNIAVEGDIEIKEMSNRRGIRSDLCQQWFLLRCTGDLSRGISSFKVNHVEIYSQRQFNKNPLSDALVPYIHADELESAAEDFLKRYYPEALTTPMAIDPTLLAQRMGLTILAHGITPDCSVFGELFFADCDAELYDIKNDSIVTLPVKRGTIIVDPQNFFLRNLGSTNNTIIHECVHWDKHIKAFELERMYNDDAQQIRCQVVGGIRESGARTETEWMEWQANCLAPRIQMPLRPFREKANQLIRDYKIRFNTTELIDVIEKVIDELEVFFCVSKTAAKIRMVDAGFEEAMGAYNYIDGKYVPTHKFKKGAIRRTQTYSIGIDDASVIGFSDMAIGALMKDGVYVYVDSHLCLNSPKYVSTGAYGSLHLTEYARLHIDECCIAFDLKVKATNKYGERYYTECTLFRDSNSGIEFQVSFAPNINSDVNKQATAIGKVISESQTLTTEISTMSFGEALTHLMKWADNITVEKLAEEANMDLKTVSRMRNNPDYPKSIESVIAVCLAMHLPPAVSSCLLGKSGFTFKMTSEAHLYYKFFMENMYMHPLTQLNEILSSKGFDELGA